MMLTPDKNPEPLLVSDTLLEQAEQACQRRLAKDPDNRTALASLGKTYRKQGRLDDARNVYERLSRIDPDDRETAYLHAALAGVRPPRWPEGVRPAPFVLFKNFLP